MDGTKPPTKKPKPIIIRFSAARKVKNEEPKSSIQKLTPIVKLVKLKLSEESDQLEQEELNIKPEPEEHLEISDPQEHFELAQLSVRPEQSKHPKDLKLSLIKPTENVDITSESEKHEEQTIDVKLNSKKIEHVHIKTEPPETSEPPEPPKPSEFSKHKESINPKKDIEHNLKLSSIKVKPPEEVNIKTEPQKPREPESVKAKIDIEPNIKLIKVEPPDPDEVIVKTEPIEPPEDLNHIKLEPIGSDDPLGNNVVHNDLLNSSESSFNCSKCSKVFRDFHSLHNHLMSHNNEALEEKPTICKVCKKCVPKSQLEKHMKIHSTERRNSNSKISKSINFYAKSCLIKQNQRSYTGDKPFACEDCGMRFLTSDNMKRHQLIHKQAKPYMCKVCLERFSEKICLTRHELRKGHHNYKMK